MTASDTQKSLLQRIFSKRMLLCIFLGFSSGLPFYFLFNLVSAWLKDEGINIGTIGAFSLLTLPYAWKFVWAPALDLFFVKRIGRRRTWMFLTQTVLLICLALMGLCSPKIDFHLYLIMILYFLVAFFSATQDVAIDAFRREILDDEELGLGNSIFVNAYRFAGLVPGTLSLYMSDRMPWSITIILTAMFMFVGLGTTFMIREAECQVSTRTIKESVVEPLKEFIGRKGVWSFLSMLLFIFLYKFGDNMATALATPFYMDMGYTKSVIGTVNKVVGFWALLAGSIIGGIIMLKIGINKALWLFGLAQIVTILGFVFITHVWQNQGEFVDILASADGFINGIAGNIGITWFRSDLASGFEFPNTLLLSLVISGENLGAGLGTACFVAYMCRETKGKYIATQLALLTALSALPRTLCTSRAGYIINSVGYENFFIICYALAIPGMLMLIYIAPYGDESGKKAAESVSG